MQMRDLPEQLEISLMGFAFDPNRSDHNGIDDTAERTKDTIKMSGGSIL